jgi:hypothetical protein
VASLPCAARSYQRVLDMLDEKHYMNAGEQKVAKK